MLKNCETNRGRHTGGHRIIIEELGVLHLVFIVFCLIAKKSLIHSFSLVLFFNQPDLIFTNLMVVVSIKIPIYGYFYG